MARRRRRKSTRRIWIVGSLAIMAGVWTYGHFVSPVLEGETPDGPVSNVSAVDLPGASAPGAAKLMSSRPAGADAEAARHGNLTSEGSAHQVAEPADPERTRRARSLLTAGEEALQNGDLIAARARYREAVDVGLDHEQLIAAREVLVRIADQTIFSGAIVRDDPLVRRHIVGPGETLGKIAKAYGVTADLLATINHLADKNRIRAGQTIKVVQGPFHARIDKKAYRMDVYLQTTYVKQYPVGLGADDSTPSGEWLVGTKLTNPTYYPPRGGDIVAADDPENPLGEYWIELKGVAGDAVGQERYGIHGTVDPDSIGRGESLGCIRLHNPDVAELYTLLVPGKSRVVVK